MDGLGTRLKGLEEDHTNAFKAAGTTAYSLDEQYSIVDTSKLLELVKLVGAGCRCGSKLFVTTSSMTGHALKLAFQCGECATTTEWIGSKEYSDGSLEVNRDMVVAWEITGGERGHYFKFAETMRCGTYNATSYDQTVGLMRPVILEMEDKVLKNNIDAVNQDNNQTILGFDCQHSRSQRSFGAAPYATTTFISHTPGPNYGKILYQSHISSHQMKEQNMTGKESKDKHTVVKGLTKMVELIDNIKHGICDGSSSGNKSWNDVVQKSAKYETKLPPLSNCFWHGSKGIPAKFNKQVLERRFRAKTKKGLRKKRGNLRFPELIEIGLTGKKVKAHFIRAQKMFPGNAGEMSEEFQGLAEFYQELSENSLPKETVKAVEKFLETNSKKMEKYALGYKTDLEESFHRVVLKYWKKGTSYSYEQYVTKRALAFLDWSENFHAAKKTSYFRKDIVDTFKKFLSTRSRAKTAQNNHYTPTKHGITQYYQ